MHKVSLRIPSKLFANYSLNDTVAGNWPWRSASTRQIQKRHGVSPPGMKGISTKEEDGYQRDSCHFVNRNCWKTEASGFQLMIDGELGKDQLKRPKII
jgi:hypothetical protein